MLPKSLSMKDKGFLYFILYTYPLISQDLQVTTLDFETS